MAQQSTVKRSAAAAGANTDTVIFTPAAGLRYKILGFYVVNETAAQVAGMDFELRYGANIIALAGFDVAAAPIGQQSKQAIIAHEFIGDGVTTVVARNLTALNAASIAAYVVNFDANYAN
jgi:hypothetical protein